MPADLINPIEAIFGNAGRYNDYVAPDYSQMFIFVELIAQRKERTALEKKDGIVVAKNVFSNQKITLLGPSTDQKNNYVNTTRWTQNYGDTTNSQEGFGIQNISIETNSSYIPKVTIEFVDIKGFTFFNIGKNSPYAVLFDFPPPLYELTVKGYFGKSLTYQLHLVKTNTRFDSKTGNFIISAEFVARTFAPLTDVPFKYIETLGINSNVPENPDSVPENVTTNPDSQTGNYDLINTDNSVKPRNINELIKKIERVYRTVGANTQTEDGEIKNISVNIEKGKTSQERVFYFGDILNINSTDRGVFRFNKNELVDDEGPQIDKFSKLKPNTYLSYFNNNNNQNSTTIDVNTEDRLLLSFVDTGKDNENNTIFDSIKKNVIENISSDIFNVDSKMEDSIVIQKFEFNNKKWVGVDITNPFLQLQNKITVLMGELQELENNRTLKIQKTITEVLNGWQPTIKNVFEVICDDVDTFFRKLATVSKNGYEHHKEYQDLILGDTNFKDRISPFPLYVENQIIENTTTKVRRVPDPLSQKTNKPFPELDFIDDFIDKFKFSEKADLNEDVVDKKDGSGNNVWIPLNPLDSKYGNLTLQSPYALLEKEYLVQNGGESNIRTNFLTKVLERFYVTSQYFLSRSFYGKGYGEQLVDFIAAAEAANIANSLIASNYLRNIENLAKNFEINNFYDEVLSNVPLYKNLESEEYLNLGVDISSGEYLDLLGKDRKNIYSDQNNENYVGFEIIDGPVLERPSTSEITKRGQSDNDGLFSNYFGDDDSEKLDPVEKLARGFTNMLEKGRLNNLGASRLFSNGGLRFTTENIFLYLSGVDVDGKTKNLGYPYYIDSKKKEFNEVVVSTFLTDIHFDLKFTEETTPDTHNFPHLNLDRKNKFLSYLKDNNFNDPESGTTKAMALLFGSAFGQVLTPFGNKMFEDVIEQRIVYGYGYSPSKTKRYNINLLDNSGIVEVPYYLLVFMGGVLDLQENYNSWGDDFNEVFNEYIYGTKDYDKVNHATDIINYQPDVVLGDNFKEEFTNVIAELNNFSDKDKETLKKQFYSFINNDLNRLINKIIDLLSVDIFNFKDIEGYEPTIINDLDLDINRGYGTDANNLYEDMVKLYDDILKETIYKDITETLLRNKYVLVFNEAVFSKDYELPPTFEPLEKQNLVEAKKNVNNNYFTKLFGYLKQALKNREEQINDIDVKYNKNINDNDIRTRLYYSFKNISDKWVATTDFGGQIDTIKGSPTNGKDNRLFSSFHFVDRANNDIGDKVVLNLEALLEAVDDYDASVFSVISKLLSVNNFEFFPLQNFMSFKENDWADSFKMDSGLVLKQDNAPAFVCMYIGGTSKYLNNVGGDFDDDGIKDLETDNDIVDFTQSTKAFRVRFGAQNQSLFTDIQLDSNEHVETNESLQILSQIAQDDSNSKPITKAQNLFNTYETRSYTAKVSMFGNAMIQPTQYFQLENVPMFSGAYLILKVAHSIQNNTMKTDFEGVRVLKYPNPLVTRFDAVLGIESPINPLIRQTLKEDLDVALARLEDLDKIELATSSGFIDANNPPNGYEKLNSINKTMVDSFLHPLLKQPVTNWINEVKEQLGIELIIASGYRTYAEQTVLRNRYLARLANAKANNPQNAGETDDAYNARISKTKEAGLPAASPGYSLHNFGMAFDANWYSIKGKRYYGGSTNGPLATNGYYWDKPLAGNEGVNGGLDTPVKIAEKYKFLWGGTFNDEVHFYRNYGYTGRGEAAQVFRERVKAGLSWGEFPIIKQEEKDKI